jgi:hypothetical protein
MLMKPLREYVDILLMFAESSCELVDESTFTNFAKVQALDEAGCLSGIDTSTVKERSLIDVALTPKGAQMLTEWNGLIERGSLKGRVLAGLELMPATRR